MSTRGLPMPCRLPSLAKLGRQVLGSALLISVAFIINACGTQSPSFTENHSVKPFPTPNADAVPIDNASGSTANIGKEGDQTPIFGSDNGGTNGSGDVTAANGGTDGAVAGSDGGGGGTTGGSGSSGGSGGSSGGSDGSTGGSGGTGNEGHLDINFVTMNLTQKGPGKVDILWVVDTSDSMTEEQQSLGQNFNALISKLAAAGNDFQTAITTTDICQDQIPADLSQRVCPVDYGGSSATHLRGSFVGDAGNKVLKQGQSDLIQKFTRYASQGVNGSGFEHGLKAAEMAITKSLNGQNEALIRPDAFLAVIVVSDEEDDGIGLSKIDAYNGHNFYAEGLTTFRYTEDDMINYLKTVKGSGHFSVSAITGTRNPDGSMCTSPHSQPAEEGTQYIAAAKKTGGIIQSICDTDWNDSLSEIGLDLNAQITQVSLQSAPDVPTIKVYIDGSLSSEWTYNGGNNAVKFNAGHVPTAGSDIKITYYKLP